MKWKQLYSYSGQNISMLMYIQDPDQSTWRIAERSILSQTSNFAMEPPTSFTRASAESRKLEKWEEIELQEAEEGGRERERWGLG